MTEWGIAPKAEEIFIGLDIGQARDWTAFVLAARTPSPSGYVYNVDHVERWRELPYTAIVGLVRDRIAALNVVPAHGGPKPRISLVADYTGVGRAVVDMLNAADLGVPVTAINITGGLAAAATDAGFSVPKRDLATVVQVLLQGGRLRIAEALPLASTLVDELRNFRVKINAGGHASFGAGDDWRDGNHDDLVLGAAMACWAGENEPTGWEDISAEGLDIRAFFGGR